MSAYVATAIAELHAARSSMQNAFLALNKAILTGETVDIGDRRLIFTEVLGTGEEAVVIAALLAAEARTRLPDAPHDAPN